MPSVLPVRTHPLIKFFCFVAVVVVGGALFSPWLYALAQWGLGAGILPQALAAFKFPKYVTRGMLVVAFVGVWPFIRWLGVRSWSELGLKPDARWMVHYALGIALGVTGLASVAVIVLATHTAVLKDPLPWLRLFDAAGTAIAVALFEELMFRGVLFGLVRRTMPWVRALLIVSAVFAVLHFVRAPRVAPTVDEIHWWSGLALLQGHLWQFGEPLLLVAALPTYFLVGCTLAYAVAKTDSLWLSIGLHTGWVFSLRGFQFLSRRVSEPSIWLGSDLIGGLVPAALVAATWGVLIYVFRSKEAST